MSKFIFISNLFNFDIIQASFLILCLKPWFISGNLNVSFRTSTMAWMKYDVSFFLTYNYCNFGWEFRGQGWGQSFICIFGPPCSCKSSINVSESRFKKASCLLYSRLITLELCFINIWDVNISKTVSLEDIHLSGFCIIDFLLCVSYLKMAPTSLEEYINMGISL